MLFRSLISRLSDDFERALGPACDAMFTLLLFLGLHRKETPTAMRRFVKNVQSKIHELLTFDQQCKAGIIENGLFEINAIAAEPISDRRPSEALAPR